MVRDLLCEPDKRAPNPYYRSAPPIRLYAVARVQEAERSEEFEVARAAAERRSAAGKAAGKRREAVLAAVRAVEIEVPGMADRELAERAVRWRNELDKLRAGVAATTFPSLRRWGVRSPAPWCEVGGGRWEVNYLRHALTRYDDLLDGLYGATGRAEAEQLLRIRVYGAIAARYPRLADECRRQLRERGVGAGGVLS
ncbi:hypothetical protein ACH4SP_18055 [Streptomyces sp. NPDC021093]|uniref:hypothetical protein n=1 Tax=Streptomyces sp. NPDC021093 TaxID=3365112 RepID=UPI0037BAC433